MPIYDLLWMNCKYGYYRDQQVDPESNDGSAQTPNLNHKKTAVTKTRPTTYNAIQGSSIVK
jgi:hypothetical protein